MRLALLVNAALWFVTVSGTTAIASPLFDEQTPLALTIEVPMRELIRKRLENPVYDAVVRYKGSSGEETVLRAQLTSRGNARLDVCEFPPLRLMLKKGDAKGTIFEGQTRLKMVTQCSKRNDAEKWLLQELGIYRAYNNVTDFSYRTRRLDVTYRDSESSRREETQVAFFIEPTDALATRLKKDSIRPPLIEPDQYSQVELTKNMLFQLLIANTDFSAKRGPSGEGCCHNGRVLTEPGAQKGWVIVPYDFDQAGIINTDYALPDRRLGIRTVNVRLYRGFCWQNDALPAVIDVFQNRRDAITAALIPSELSSTRQKRIRRFVDGFYDILDDPTELRSRIADKCRGAATFPIRKTTLSDNQI
jgi:hypothetical protein